MHTPFPKVSGKWIVYALLSGFILLAFTPMLSGSATAAACTETGSSEASANTAAAAATTTSIFAENVEEAQEVELTVLFAGFYEERIPLAATPGESYVWVAPYINAVTTPPPESFYLS